MVRRLQIKEVVLHILVPATFDIVDGIVRNSYSSIDESVGNVDDRLLRGGINSSIRELPREIHEFILEIHDLFTPDLIVLISLVPRLQYSEKQFIVGVLRLRSGRNLLTQACSVFVLVCVKSPRGPDAVADDPGQRI